MLRIGNLTKAQRWAIADRLAAERLPIVNRIHEAVIPADGLYVRYGKRVIDVAVAGAALLVTAPVNILLAVGTLASVGRPILFMQERTGKDGKKFTLVKFRNMTNERDGRGELLPPEQRVTRFGEFVRKTSLDELLNFWPILKGDMSVIGPRPLPPEYEHRYSNRHHARLAVRPGLECPPRGELDHVWTWQEQLENDVWYVEHVSPRTDFMMLLNLVRFAFDRRSTLARAHGGDRGIFVGYDLDGRAITYQELSEEEFDHLLGIGASDE